MSKPTILVLVTNTGGGHLNLAQALRDALDAHYTLQIVNAQAEQAGASYTFMSRHFPAFLTWQYTISDFTPAAWVLQHILTALGAGRVRTIIERVQPQLIIATHAFLASTVAHANASSAHPVPLIFQLTDLGRLHMTWFVEKHADAYLAPTREIFAQACNHGIARERLFLTGRPIRRQFLDASPDGDKALLKTLGLDPSVFTLFLQGGATGSGGVNHVVENILQVAAPLQILLAVGNNQVMAQRYGDHPRVSVIPFTPELAPYMAAADLIAGKAGASFISEAFMLEKPFLATAFIPGQETANLRFIEAHQLGWVCLRARAQRQLLTRLIDQPELIAQKSTHIRAYKAWNTQANADLGAVIERLLPPTQQPDQEALSRSSWHAS